MKDQWILHDHIVMIIVAIIVGTLARVITLKEDYRQNPNYPNGYLIHLVTGFVAAALGAVAIPALMTKNFVAVTFLTLAIQQFRDVRKAEGESLKSLENTEPAFRGSAYIDGIAKTFESRNYFSLIVSLFTAITMQVIDSHHDWINILAGLVVGFLLIYFLKRFSKGKTIGDIADVKEGTIHIKGSELYVNDLFVSNFLGTEDAHHLFQTEGLAVIIHPHEYRFGITLNNFGQRQAALFEAVRAIGVKQYHYINSDFKTGTIMIALVPIVHDIDRLIESVKKTPLLESVKKSPAVMDSNFAGKE